ncbi:glycosyltransferase family 2 protein [Muribaculaceae bacterium Isolate-110 (HZI)]|nr:glycosyltransferase family 2 protein [Muribaculaceae bacterium Isolate-110 (HZI)]
MISVIIPAYNAQAYLRECLESVLAQSFSDWEAIIVDDGSTDSTREIAAGFTVRDSRFRLVSTPNGGLSSARNAGIAEARGQWLTYLDSDDTLYPDALARLMAATTENVDIVVAGLSRDRDVAAVTDDSVEIMSGLTALERGLYQRGVTTSACAKLFSRRVADGITFPDGLYYEDLLYCVETLRRSARVAVIGDVVYYYRDNPSSFINTFSPRRLDVLRVTARVEELLEGDEELLRAARSRRLSACFNIYGLLAVHDRDGRYSDVSCRCWTLIKDYRRDSLFDPRVRLKNKVGILLSYMGPRVFGCLAGMVY